MSQVELSQFKFGYVKFGKVEPCQIESINLISDELIKISNFSLIWLSYVRLSAEFSQIEPSELS